MKKKRSFVSKTIFTVFMLLFLVPFVLSFMRTCRAQFEEWSRPSTSTSTSLIEKMENWRQSNLIRNQGKMDATRSFTLKPGEGVEVTLLTPPDDPEYFKWSHTPELAPAKFHFPALGPSADITSLGGVMGDRSIPSYPEGHRFFLYNTDPLRDQIFFLSVRHPGEIGIQPLKK